MIHWTWAVLALAVGYFIGALPLILADWKDALKKHRDLGVKEAE